MRCWAIVLTTTVLLTALPAAHGAPATCQITEGIGIAGIRIGMPVAAALATAGSPLRQELDGGETVYTLRPPLARMAAANGVVVRVSTQSPECATVPGVRPGAARAAITAAYASAVATIVTPLPNGDLVAYPFNGIRFVVRTDRVQVVEVFTPESFPRTVSIPSPSPASRASPSPAGPPASAGTWTIVSASNSVEGTTLVITGTAENRGPAMNAFADVAAYDGSGGIVGRGSAPLSPSPVLSGSRARFEVRFSIVDIVRRYTVDLRPAGSAGISLARSAVGIGSIAGFGAFVVPHLRAEVRATRTPPSTWDDLALAVTNTSAYAVSSLVVEVEVRLVCRVGGGGGVFGIVHTGRERVGPVGAAGTAQFAMGMASDARRDCPGFSDWMATTRILSVELAEERRAVSPGSRAAKGIAPRRATL